MTPLYFDIETIPTQLPGVRDEFIASVEAPGQYKKPESIAAWLDENREAEGEAAWLKTSFDGGVGHCIAISLAFGDEAPHTYKSATPDHEKEMLEHFFCHLADCGPHTLVGHNIIGFDIPFLWKRAMVLGVKPPFTFPRAPKPWGELVKDTMLLWDSTQRAGGSMDRICKLMGIPGKGGISGKDVWPMYQAGKIEEIATYCAEDVERTRAMYKRMTFTD